MERDGNGWVECSLGHRHWGLHGAAGLLVHTVAPDGTLRVLLQHRADWCHHGGTWGLPGGARDSHETVEQAALREALEETEVDTAEVRVRHTFVDDHGGWSYTTVYGDCVTPLETVPNEESAELGWIDVERVDDLVLHPGFGHTWPTTRLRPIVVVVDAANVVGSVPDGWWKDRAGATERLGLRLLPLRSTTLHDGQLSGVVAELHVVVEGAARSAELPGPIVTHKAPGSGDDAVVAESELLSVGRRSVVVVTSDRELAHRARQVAPGVEVRGAGWLLNLLDP